MSTRRRKRSREPTSPIVRVGTCGYSYRDWVGPLYAQGTKSGEMLERYAEHFDTVEIDATYYRVPGRATFESMDRRTPDDFRFSMKLPGTATHLPEPGATVHDDVKYLLDNAEPLTASRKLACVLAQFPTSFRPNERTREYLGTLAHAVAPLALVVEFRHRDWQTPETLALLRDARAGIVNVDEPHFSSLPRESGDATGSVAYVRFHGRNAANWWRGTNVTRYDYEYSPDELAPWVDRIRDVASDPDVREVFAYFNNHARGQDPRNAELFEEMLRAASEELVRVEPAVPKEPAALELPLDVAQE